MNTTFEKQLERIKEVTGCFTQNALAQFFDITPESCSENFKKKNISPDMLLTLVEKERVNPEWIKTGEGVKRFEMAKTEVLLEARAIEAMLPLVLKLLPHIPAVHLLEELHKRSDELQREYEEKTVDTGPGTAS